MDNRYTTFGIIGRGAAAWSASVLMLLSAVVRVVYYAMGGSEGAGSPAFILLLVIIPAAACVFFAAELLIHGRDRLYKTGFAVLLGVAFFISRAFALYNTEGSAVTSIWQTTLCILLYIAVGIVWELTVNGARLKTKLPIILLTGLPLLYQLAVIDIPQWVRGGFLLFDALPEISALLIMAGLFTTALGMKKITSERIRPRRGDRCDGRRVRGLSPLTAVALYVMPNRNGAATYFRDSFECAKADAYIRKKRDEGFESFGYMHLIVAAYVRTISQRPEMNRFISGQRVYTRDGEIELAMVVKKDMTADSPETIIKVYFKPDDTADDVYRKFNEQVALAKDTPLESGFDKLAWMIDLIPGLLKKFAVWFIKLMDYFGFLPRELMKLSPFHGSLFITSLGSLGVPPVFHHLYDIGNIPAFMAFGTRRIATENAVDGTPVKKKYLDYTVVSDERICDGFNYASAIKMVKRYMNNPERLDNKPDEVIYDIY